jgi:hypothetical protein
VSIYTSEFGKTQLEQEKITGPPRDIFPADAPDDESSLLPSTSLDDQFNQDNLRKYQLARLKYYYAVITCSSLATARQIYDQCDGLELESSANTIDLRYIPVDTVFDVADVVGECTTGSKGYTPVQDFFTAALQHTRVDLSWDRDDVKRGMVLRKKRGKKDVFVDDFNDYLASEDSDSEIEGGAEKYRSLLETKEESEEEDGVQVVFGSALDGKSEKAGRKRVAEVQGDYVEGEADAFDDDFFCAPTKATGKKKEVKPVVEEETLAEGDEPDSRELDLVMTDDINLDAPINDESRHFDIRDVLKSEKLSKKKKSKGKGRKRDELDQDAQTQPGFNMDVEDERFSRGLVGSHEFFIDPTNPKFKKTRGMDDLRSSIATKKRK